MGEQRPDLELMPTVEEKLSELCEVIAALEAENARLREVCPILVAQWGTRYRMENASLWEQELYAQARAALEPAL